MERYIKCEHLLYHRQRERSCFLLEFYVRVYSHRLPTGKSNEKVSTAPWTQRDGEKKKEISNCINLHLCVATAFRCEAILRTSTRRFLGLPFDSMSFKPNVRMLWLWIVDCGSRNRWTYSKISPFHRCFVFRTDALCAQLNVHHSLVVSFICRTPHKTNKFHSLVWNKLPSHIYLSPAYLFRALHCIPFPFSVWLRISDCVFCLMSAELPDY